MKKMLISLGVLSVLVAGAVYWYHRSQATEVTESLFTYDKVDQAPMRETISATGPLQARDVLLVTSEASGTVLKVRADVNDFVGEGDVLLELDARKIELK